MHLCCWTWTCIPMLNVCFLKQRTEQLFKPDIPGLTQAALINGESSRMRCWFYPREVNHPRPTLPTAEPPLYTHWHLHISTRHLPSSGIPHMDHEDNPSLLVRLLTVWCVSLNGSFVFLFTVKATVLISQCLIIQARHHLTCCTGLCTL